MESTPSSDGIPGRHRTTADVTGSYAALLNRPDCGPPSLPPRLLNQAATARLLLVPALEFWLLPLAMAAAFMGVQMGVFGLYMGAAFAPNRKGMPLLPTNSRPDFPPPSTHFAQHRRRQVHGCPH
jgi:hypothetical protein